MNETHEFMMSAIDSQIEALRQLLVSATESVMNSRKALAEAQAAFEAEFGTVMGEALRAA
ncbi:hypothetical protein [Aureimonas sp. SK2]|uniref:hypothetical protein n=1 Tax=Aureimonas sp. SK2 TaxID=3015992 RepID=UPI002444B0BF|nr:hypothetical protein [Aureimonas sp. SK2]